MEAGLKTVGLSSREAELALKEFGYNELKADKRFTGFSVFFSQFNNLIVWILISASVISHLIGENLNFWVINGIILFVILMGFAQEFKAEKAMEALKKIVQPETAVIRDGKLMEIPSREVVPGDVMSLETGDQIGADADLLKEVTLKVDESTLTGESLAIEKKIGERIFAGTQIVHGRCVAHVIATGMKTKLGGIARLIQNVEEPTPLQKKMEYLGRLLAVLGLISALLIWGAGILRGASPVEMLVVALALAVAAVPEGLPLTMTLALSFGMHRMAKKNAIVRRLMAVETLGNTTVICSDKTGTITKNEMTVQAVAIGEERFSVTGIGYKPVGKFQKNEKSVPPPAGWDHFLKAMVLCNNAELIEGEDKEWEIIGEPTEGSLLTMAAKAGVWKDRLENDYQRVEEILFTSARKMMTTIHHHQGKYHVFSKGAPEIIIEKCEHLSAAEKKKWHELTLSMGKDGLRVLAFAMKSLEEKAKSLEHAEKNLTFLGLVGMRDPARPEVKEAIETCAKAGIRVIMITGDNEHTALSVARLVGLADENSRVVTGKTMTGLTDHELMECLKETTVFARTQPEDKLRIVQVLKKLGHVVAMTGDGVNDAPALKESDIGIAMGKRGTDVAKEAADMVLQDDHFATIVEAVREGRRIYENIRKFTAYLLSGNFMEMILIAVTISIYDFHLLPLLAVQILFINAFNEEIPALGLGLDQASPRSMERPPRPRDEKLLSRGDLLLVFCMAIYNALMSFVIFLSYDPHEHLTKARTMVFATVLILMMVRTFNFRSLRESVLRIAFFGNIFIVAAMSLILCITFFVMYTPFTQALFQIVPLGPLDWLVAFLAAGSASVVMELVKLALRLVEKKQLQRL